MEEIFGPRRRAQAHCRCTVSDTSETEMSTAPWHRIVCVCSYSYSYSYSYSHNVFNKSMSILVLRIAT